MPETHELRLVVVNITDATPSKAGVLRRRITKETTPARGTKNPVAMDNGPIPTYRGIPLKYISLVTLTIQNSALILIMHYSRIMPGYEQERYFPSTAVLLNEVLKLAISVVLHYRELRSRLGSKMTWKQLMNETFTSDAWKLTIPAVLYTVGLTK